METVKSLEESGLLVKGISETGKGMIRAGDRMIRARQYF